MPSFLILLKAIAHESNLRYKANEIKALREREHVSQSIFALYLNISCNLVSDWERGVKKPGGPASRLLNIVQKHGLEALVS